MLQRGRKSRLQWQTLALVRNAPALSHEPPQPFYRLDQPEKRMWEEIHRDYDFSYCGDLLLCMALQSLGRARKCSELIEEQGAMIPGRKNVLKPHPLLSVERASRALCASLIKKLKIELRDDYSY